MTYDGKLRDRVVEGVLLLSALVAVAITLAVLNLLRSPTGRAFVAMRDSEISAQSMGINLARYKTTSFALSAAITGNKLPKDTNGIYFVLTSADVAMNPTEPQARSRA